jgi:hypothetical protein
MKQLLMMLILLSSLLHATEEKQTLKQFTTLKPQEKATICIKRPKNPSIPLKPYHIFIQINGKNIEISHKVEMPESVKIQPEPTR